MRSIVKTESYKLNKKIFFYMTMFLSVFVLMVIAGEIILRIGGWASPMVRTVTKAQYSKVPGMFAPGQSVVVKTNRHLPYRVNINSLGFRGEEFDKNREGGYKILCIGDSQTFGDFVDDSQTFPHVLQELCQRTSQDTLVINAGVGGTTIVDQLQFLRRCIKIKPSLVILNFTENDIEDLLRVEPMYVKLEKNREMKSSPLGKPIYDLIKDSCLFNFCLKIESNYYNYIARRKILKLNEHSNTFDNDVTISMVNQTINYESNLLSKYQSYLIKSKQVLDEFSIPLLFIIFPGTHRLDEGPFEHQSPEHRLQQVEALALKLGIESINLLPTFQKGGYTKEQLYLVPYDKHASSLAYRIAAQEIFNWLQYHKS